VLIVRKMSSRDEPPRNVQLCARSAGRIGWPQSSFSVGADEPVAAAERAVALHAAGLLVKLLAERDRLAVAFGALGQLHGLGTFSASRSRGEGRHEIGEIRHFLSERSARRASTCTACRA
jgi:hypothetical protein